MKKTLIFLFLMAGQLAASAVNYTLTLYAEGCMKYNTYVCSAGQELKIYAQPQEHFHFVRWSDGNTDNPRSVVITQETSYIAQFAPNQYTLTVQSSDNLKGGVQGSGTYEYASPQTISATANYGYHFVRWSDGSTTNPRIYTISDNATITADFAANDYGITLAASSPTMGMVNGAGTSPYLSTKQIAAIANHGYHFVQWNDGISESPRAVVMTQDTAFTAEFAPNQYTLTVQSSDDTKGSVTGSGTFGYKTEHTITATANTGYHFVRWSDGSTTNPRTYTISDNATIIAEFDVDDYLSANGVQQ